MAVPSQDIKELLKSGRTAEALAILEERLRHSPNDADSLRLLARIRRRLGQLAHASEVYRKLIATGAAVPRDHQELALLYAGGGQLDLAVEQFRAALALNPRYAPAHCNLGLVLEDLGRHGEAIDALREAQRLARDEPVIAYHLAALGAAAPPAACPPEYLVQLFDGYAPRFEQHLVRQLRYQGPQLLLAAARPHLPDRPVDVIDLGCGTGLCGVVFRNLARHIIGVDLSPVMVELARAKNAYDEVVRADIVTALLARPQSADLIVAADLFIYVGELSRAFNAAKGALRPGGLFAFTLETTDQADYVLGRTRRYAHSLAYVRRMAGDAGLIERSASSAFLRAGDQGPVTGYVVVLSRQ